MKANVTTAGKPDVSNRAAMEKTSLLDLQQVVDVEPDIPRLVEAIELLSSDPPRGLAALEKLAGEGSILSMEYLGIAYSKGSYANPEKAEYWYRAQYDRGYIVGLYRLGLLYYRRGDFEKAKPVFLRGALEGDSLSMFRLALIYMKTEPKPMTKERLLEVKDLLERAMAKGQVRAQQLLAMMLLELKFGPMGFPRGVILFFGGFFKYSKMVRADPTDWKLR